MQIERRYKSHHDALSEYNHYSKKDKITKEVLLQELSNANLDESIAHAIYIHVPFCDKICSFCNLNRSVKDDRVLNYHLKVIEQIEEFAQVEKLRKLRIGSIYFGGGTPTTLEGEQIAAIIKTIQKYYNVEKDCEISVETTLHNLDLTKLKILELNGVNRLSIGIQTFDTEGRKYFNRTFNSLDVLNKLKEIRHVFNGIVTMDKIYNYHLEDKTMLENDIKFIQEADVDSISFYSLMIHKGSSLSHNLNYKVISDENDQEFHDYFVKTMLESDQYDILELTKIIKKDRDKYRYITIRNSGGYTIPFGQGAGGNIGVYKIMNMSLEMPMIFKETNLKMEKADLIYGLLQFNQFDLSKLEKYFNNEEIKYLESILGKMVEKGYLKNTKKLEYTHTLEGLFYGNNVCAHLVKEYLNEYDYQKKERV